MLRINKLIKQYNKMKENNIQLILVQIDEAHSNKWKIGLYDHPENQKNMNDRINRANEFNKLYPFFNVYIDDWNNNFQNIFQSWPDQFYLINNDFIVINKSFYKDAIIVEDYSDIIDKLLDNNS
jgi:hypothetical protein